MQLHLTPAHWLPAGHQNGISDALELTLFLPPYPLQAQLDLLVAAASGLKEHLQVPGNTLRADLLLQGPGGVHISPAQDETLKVLPSWGRHLQVTSRCSSAVHHRTASPVGASDWQQPVWLCPRYTI